MSKQGLTTPLEVPHFNKYVEPTVELVLRLLADAYADEDKLDRVLKELSEEVWKEVEAELKRLEKSGTLNLSNSFNLLHNPNAYRALKRIEQIQLRKLTEYYWIGYQVITESLTHSYLTTLNTTYDMFGYTKAFDPYHLTVKENNALHPFVKVRDTHVFEHVLKVPWCQDGKVYSDRLYGHVSQFQQKLSFVLEEGIIRGKGMEWMQWAWRELTKSTAYNTARLLKTETMAMWSLATKSAYLEMGIEYVVIVGDAECGGICLDYVDGDAIPLAEAELGDLLPPYHPNCACSFVAYEESVPVELE